MTIAIIGAGLAGLSAALEATKKRQKFLLFEASSEVGGKLKTINWSSFPLDIGFQVLLASYPSLFQIITPEEFTNLNPCYFDSGALIFKNDKTYCLSDPSRDQKNFFRTLFCPLISIKDKIQTWSLKNELKEYSFTEIWEKKEWQKETALDFLTSRGFSEKFIKNFAMPFFGGVFGNNSLFVRANCLAFCFKAFSEGKTFIPAQGIGELPQILQKKIPIEMLKFNAVVEAIQAEEELVKIILQDGKYHLVKSVILATDLEGACKLFNIPFEDLREKYYNLYFVSKVSLYDDKKIFLNANPQGIINNGVQISNLSPKLSIKEQEHLISVTILKDSIPDLAKTCLRELEELFPHAKSQISFLKQFEISGKNSLFKQDLESTKKLHSLTNELKAKLPPNVFLAGEYLTGNCSQETTIQSGIAIAKQAL